MKRLSIKYRAQLSDKIMEWANLLFVGLIIGQLVPKIQFNSLLTTIGTAAFLIAYYAAYQIMEGGGKK